MVNRIDIVDRFVLSFDQDRPYEATRSIALELRAAGVSKEVVYDCLHEAKLSVRDQLSDGVEDSIDDVLDQLAGTSPEFRRID